jgi:hypothetical protein
MRQLRARCAQDQRATEGRRASGVRRAHYGRRVTTTEILALIGALTGVPAAAAEVTRWFRDRQRLRVSVTLKTSLGQQPLIEIFVLNDGPRSTTVREVGLFARPVKMETVEGRHPGLRFDGDVTFKVVDQPVFFEAREGRPFVGTCPDVTSYGIHADLPLRPYAVDARGRRAWGRALPVVRLLIGPDPPFSDDDPPHFRRLLEPSSEPLYPWPVEPRWKLWKRRELRNPKVYKPLPPSPRLSAPGSRSGD